MKEIIKAKIQGLKCDNPKCDYRNDDICVEDYPKWINAKCPKCGEILLTQKDFDNVKSILELSKQFNELFSDVDIGDINYTEDYSLTMDGTGDIDIKKINK